MLLEFLIGRYFTVLGHAITFLSDMNLVQQADELKFLELAVTTKTDAVSKFTLHLNSLDDINV